MIYYSMLELDLCVGLLMIIIYGLTSLRGFKYLNLADVHFACQCWPLLAVVGMLSESAMIPETLTALELPLGMGGVEETNQLTLNSTAGTWLSPLQSVVVTHSFDILLALITVVVLRGFKSFESILLMMMAYVAQAFMLHSCDLVSFYVCLEAQNFCFLVLCGLQPDKRSNGFSVEASLKYLLLSAFSSGILLFCFSVLYLQTGMTSLFLKTSDLSSPGTLGGTTFSLGGEAFIILLALLFKLGSAPVHLWVVYIYQSIKRPLLLYISTAPKLSLFSFWASAWQLVWTDYTLSIFIVYTLILGSLGAYGFASQPAVRALFAYSTISEIGFMLLATETAGFHSLFQHLSIYIVTQIVVWHLSDKRLFSLCAISLAGLPPLAGFFGKAFIFAHAVNLHMVTLLFIALTCTVLSIVYYIRLLRLFWNLPTGQSLYSLTPPSPTVKIARAVGLTKNSGHLNTGIMGLYSTRNTFERQVGLTSACVIALIFLPVMLLKPMVL